MIRPSALEPLEARIAPAVMIVNPLFDLTPGIGKTGATIDLAKLVDDTASHRTRIEFTTNFTPAGATAPGKIVIELFDDKAPLSVQNFLSYFDNKAGTAYDGTFFHRIFDFGGGSEAGTDIIQAGGFNISKPNDHIPTDPTVHNEFDADDPELQNTRGTIAMAKTSVSPHTGSSEWFINLTNNSSILGEDNNGGFTVFGRIVTGLEVADAIGQAKKLNVGGAFTDLPVQNHTAGSPTLEQLIQITDARVVPPTAGVDDGLTYDVTVNNPDGGGLSTLVKAKVDQATNQLKLTYTKNKVGRAEVVVNLKDSTGSVVGTDSFLVNIQPNLIAEFSADTLPGTFVPGDKGTVKVKLTNNLAGLAKGAVGVKLYLSAVNGEEPLAIDDDDIEITANGAANVSIASGKSLSVPISYLIPSSQELVAGQKYNLLAEITRPDGTTLIEKFTDDNTGINPLFTQHTFDLSFGQVGGANGGRSKVPLTILMPSGETLTFSITGKGTGVVKMDGDLIDVSITGTTSTSSFSIKTARGVVGDLDDVSISDTIGSVKLGNIQLHGNFAASAGAKSIVFGDLGDNTAGAIGEDKDFTIGAPTPDSTQKVAITFGKVRDYSLSSNLPISTLSALDWLNDETNSQPDAILAGAGFGTLKIAGDLEANITSATTTKIASLSVGGTLRDSTVKVFGDVSTVKLGAISGSTILAGLTEKPDAIGDFATGTTIASLTVTGTFANSIVAAGRFNAVTVNTVDAAAGAEVGGFYADAIKSYLRKGIGGLRLTNLDAAGVFDPVEPNYAVTVF